MGTRRLLVFDRHLWQLNNMSRPLRMEYQSAWHPVMKRSGEGVFNEPGDVAVSLTRRLRGDSLNEVGKQFHMNKYSFVGSVIERMKVEISRDSAIKRRVDQLTKLLARKIR